MERANFEEIKNTDIWKIFSRKNTNKLSETAVYEHLYFAYTESEKIKETFPSYTLHNGIHQFNVLKMMGELLTDFDEISDLECALLLLSAFYHDLGMVYNKDIAEIKNEEDFDEYLKIHPSTKLKYYKNNNLIDDDIQESYCRWAHAKRVNVFLTEFSLKYDGQDINVNGTFGKLCESHNWTIKEILDCKELKTNFYLNADLKFCSIILRIADILDFDRTRTPENLYVQLGLSNAKTPMKKISDIEWKKHLSSLGFKVNSKTKSLEYAAVADNPNVEHEIRHFLDIIKAEIFQCVELLRFCSEGKRNFALPVKFYFDLTSNNYQYGDFKFHLQQDEVIHLLMGENIYSESEVFIREILQNAIDTTRHREAYEINMSSTQYKGDPVKLSSWFDETGYQWVRIDDYGMGMNEEKIRKFFLKIGQSYYNSAEFELDQLKFKDKYKFTPISKFGIGILSCFMIGDRIEASTKDRVSEEVFRIKIDGISNFFLLQDKSNTPNNYPNAENTVEKFRRTAGTSIAVRIDPKKYAKTLNIHDIVSRYVFDSQIDVTVDNKLIENKSVWFEPNAKITSNDSKYLIVENASPNLEALIRESFSFRITTYKVNDRNIKANFCVLEYRNIINDLGFKQYFNASESGFANKKLYKAFTYSSSHGRISETLSLSNDNPETKILRDALLDAASKNNNGNLQFTLRFDFSQLPKEIKLDDFYDCFDRDNSGSDLIVAHNGIKICEITHSAIGLNENFFKKDKFSQQGFVYSIISLKDEVRPDITVARNLIKKFPFNFFSTLYFHLYDIAALDYEFMYNGGREGLFSVQEALSDHFITSKDFFFRVKLYRLDFNSVWYSLEDLALQNLEINLRLNTISLNNENWFVIRRSLIQYFGVLFVNALTQRAKVVLKNKFGVENDESQFPILFFAEYDNTDILQIANYPINRNHFFSRWLLENGAIIKNIYPAFYNFIIKFFVIHRLKSAEELKSYVERLLLIDNKKELTVLSNTISNVNCRLII